MALRLDGKTAIVTGGSRGIGRATALSLAAEGCGVAICGRGSDGIDRVLMDLRQVSNRAWDLAADHIHVNTIYPGSIYFSASGWADYVRDDPEGYARFLKHELPEGRLGTDVEVAEVITFLCPERSRWINGAMVPVDGGQSRPSGRWFN